jgi:hypothetical protein
LDIIEPLLSSKWLFLLGNSPSPDIEYFTAVRFVKYRTEGQKDDMYGLAYRGEKKGNA